MDHIRLPSIKHNFYDMFCTILVASTIEICNMCIQKMHPKIKSFSPAVSSLHSCNANEKIIDGAI